MRRNFYKRGAKRRNLIPLDPFFGKRGAATAAGVGWFRSSEPFCRPTFAAPLPPPTRRGRKRLRLRRSFFARAAGTTLPALRATSPEGEAQTGGFRTRPYSFELRSINVVQAAAYGGPRCDDFRRWLNGTIFQIPCRGGPVCPPVPRCVTGRFR